MNLSSGFHTSRRTFACRGSAPLSAFALKTENLLNDKGIFQALFSLNRYHHFHIKNPAKTC